MMRQEYHNLFYSIREVALGRQEESLALDFLMDKKGHHITDTKDYLYGVNTGKVSYLRRSCLCTKLNMS